MAKRVLCIGRIGPRIIEGLGRTVRIEVAGDQIYGQRTTLPNDLHVDDIKPITTIVLKESFEMLQLKLEGA